jgi:carbohydrate-selective porin OprB
MHALAFALLFAVPVPDRCLDPAALCGPRSLAESTGETFPDAPSVRLEDDIPPSSEPIPERPVERPGARDRLASAGYTIALSYVSDTSRVPVENAGARTVARGLFDASVAIDLQKAAGLAGVSAFVQYLWREGPNGSSYLADAQGFSNIDAEDFQRVGEAWFEQRLAADRLRLKLGRVDANTEFAAVEAAADFLNSSMGFSPTISQLPTYPNPAPSLNVFVSLHPRLRIGAGLYGASPGPTRWRRPFAIGEIGSKWTLGAGLHGRVTVGGWRQRIGDGNAARGLGGYAIAEQAIWRGAGPAPDRGLTAFAQWGHSSSETCSTDRHLGGGVIWRPSSDARRLDAVGAGVTRVRFGLRAGAPGAHELVFGPFARLRVTEWLGLTPDLQFLRFPPGDSRAGRTIAVATLRMTLDF